MYASAGGMVLPGKWTEPASTFQRDTFHDKLVFVLLLMFGMPVVSTYWLSFQPNVVYWVGRQGRFVVFICATWLLVGYGLLKRSLANRRAFAILLIAFPACALMINGAFIKLTALNASTQLQSEDCTSFQGKFRMEAAWQAAHDILESCTAEQAQITGAPINEVAALMKLEDCSDYVRSLPQWRNEWLYLQTLERTDHCSGWCRQHEPLWMPGRKVSPYVTRDRCSLTAAVDLDTQVRRTSMQIIVYCVVFMIVILLLLGWAGL